MKAAVATPVSHLFADPAVGRLIGDRSDCLEYRDHSPRHRFNKEEIFHCELQPAHYLTEEAFRYLGEIKEEKPSLRLVTFHAATCCESPVLSGNVYLPGGKILTRGEMLRNAEVNVQRIRRVFGNDILIAVENNNYYPTQAYEIVTEGDFLSTLVKENEIYFLFDISHAKITSFHKKMKYESYKQSLPLTRLIQVHVSKHGVDSNGNYYDAHLLPNSEEFNEVRELLRNYDIQYVTVEYYKDSENLLIMIDTIRELING